MAHKPLDHFPLEEYREQLAVKRRGFEEFFKASFYFDDQISFDVDQFGRYEDDCVQDIWVGWSACQPRISELEAERDRLKLERDLLGKAIGDAGIKAGVIRPEAALSGPMLLMVCYMLAETTKGK